MQGHHISLDTNIKSIEDGASTVVQSPTDVEKDHEQINYFESSASTDDFPDGGLRAWLIVLGGICNTLATFGYINTWGVFQNYYEETLLRHSSPSSIAWIGSIQYALVYIPGLVVGRCFDLGHFRSILIASIILVVGATFLVPQCTEYWHFLLCQGVMLGLGCGGIFSATPAVVAHWFKRRRGLAMGLVATGSSIGGTIFPITAKYLLPRVGFPWTMRIFGFMLLVILGASTLLMKRRLPPRSPNGRIFSSELFLSPSYSVYCASGFITYLGIYTMLTFISTTAKKIGIDDDFAFYLVAIANAGSIFGRLCAGFLSDILGPLNIIIPFTSIAALLTYAWPFAKSQASLLGVTVSYGFASGAYVSLLSNPLMDIGNVEDVGTRIGVFATIMALGALIGPPIAGAIEEVGGFRAMGYYAGTCILLGVSLMCLTRSLVLKPGYHKA